MDQEARSISACIIRDERLSFLSTSNFIPVSVQSTIFSVSIDETDIASDFSSNPSFFYHVVESKNFHLSPFIGNIFGFILFSFLLNRISSNVCINFADLRIFNLKMNPLRKEKFLKKKSRTDDLDSEKSIDKMNIFLTEIVEQF